MTLSDISNIRLFNQKISASEFITPKEIVSWMGAMQAQDYAMVKWAIGLRLLNPKNTLIEKSINNGEIIRTHLMRPTWHFVAAEDINWMLELTAPKIKTLLKSRQKELELSEAILSKSNKIIEQVLSDGNHLTRTEIAKEFNNVSIRTNENRLSHLLLNAELEGIVCSGKIKNAKQTYALLHERVTVKKLLTRDESLSELAKRYFSSHCPSSIKDFVWWSGLSVTEARLALDSVKSFFICESINSEKYWFIKSISNYNPDFVSVCLLPAYDEFLISYKNRNASLAITDNKKTISDNGIFRPVILINGQAKGLWKRKIKNNKVIIEIDFFQPQNNNIMHLIEKEAYRFGNFLELKTELIFLKR